MSRIIGLGLKIVGLNFFIILENELIQTIIRLSHSTISSALNAMSLVVLEDLIKKKITLTDKEATITSKVVGECQSCFK